MSMKMISTLFCVFIFFAKMHTANSSPIVTKTVSDSSAALGTTEVEHETMKPDAFKREDEITMKPLQKSKIFSPGTPNHIEPGIEKAEQDQSENENFNVTDADYNEMQQDVCLKGQGSNINSYEMASRDIDDEFPFGHLQLFKRKQSSTNTLKPDFVLMSEDERQDWQSGMLRLNFLFKDSTSSS